MRVFPGSKGHVEGQWNAICDRCGWAFKSASLRREWTGLMVCSGPGTNQCHEPRHPQDFVRGRMDKQAPPWTAPEADDVFISDGDPITGDDL